MNEYDFNDLSDEALDKLISNAHLEFNRRKARKKNNLWNALREVFNDIQDMGYDLHFNGCIISSVDDLDIY